MNDERPELKQLRFTPGENQKNSINETGGFYMTSNQQYRVLDEHEPVEEEPGVYTPTTGSILDLGWLKTCVGKKYPHDWMGHRGAMPQFITVCDDGVDDDGVRIAMYEDTGTRTGITIPRVTSFQYATCLAVDKATDEILSYTTGAVGAKGLSVIGHGGTVVYVWGSNTGRTNGSVGTNL